jgi:siroheme synthase-like protein
LFRASTTSTDRRGTEQYWPLALKMSGREVLVVGGGAVAGRKVASLLDAGASVTVVAPELSSYLRSLVGRHPGRLCHELRSFVDDDVAGVGLVVAATDDGQTNRQVAHAARARNVLVNVVDDPELSDVIVPSVLDRGALQIAVSTSGRSPALAAAVRRRLEDLFAPEWAEVVELYGAARRRVMASGADPGRRRLANRSFAALDVAGLLAGGGPEAVREALDEALADAIGPEDALGDAGQRDPDEASPPARARAEEGL